jgi:polar amino acid transport system ATP-binding protein
MSAAPNQAVLAELDGVSKQYGTSVVLRDFSLTLGRGCNVLLAGRSGAGKSTILKLMLLLERVDRGRVRYAGRDVTPEPNSRSAGKLVGVRLAYVSQDIDLWPNMSVSDNLLLVLRHATDFKNIESALHRITYLLKLFSISDQSDARPHELSAGERQRVALARAMASDPDLLFLDEITSNLDQEATDRVFECLSKLTNAGVTLMFASHEKSIPSSLFPIVVTYGKYPGWG